MSDSSNRLKDIFLMAMDLSSPAQRSAYLAEACATDLALRHRLEAMLAAADVPGSFLEKPAAVLDVTTDVSASGPPNYPSVDDVADRRVGPYKLLERIGEGGMGVVYTAQQTEPMRRTVALKIIRPGMDSAQVLTRFEAERQALALMDHPNIARVLDAGSTPDGQPYFVMELVKGTTITQFCDERRLSPRERLELFVPVCQAIQHAHQKGVIHRDIKPSNVLVALYDDKPVPKVIDFGVAKATGLSLTEKTLQTSFGAIVGTPEYMSPEQATFNQLDIDTRSDVYALGVLLYELLTGSTPVDKTRFKAAAILEVLRVVREEEPPRPSVKLSTTQARASIAATRGVNPDQLAQLLRGELDWIVMKALEKDRNRRYETAAGLARDVERYLKDDVIEARPPSAGYRLRKFVKRNRGPVLAASVVALALLGGLGGLAWGMVEARWQEAQVRDALHQEAEQRQLAAEREVQAFAAKEDSGKSLIRSEGMRLLLLSELKRPTDPTLAMLLAIDGSKRHPGLLANNTLLAALDECREERTLPSTPYTLAFSPDSRRLLTVDSNQVVRIWDVLTGRELITFPKVDHPNGVKFLPGHVPSDYVAGHCAIMTARFDRDGKRVLTTTEYGCVALWDATTGDQLAFLQKGIVNWMPEDEVNRRNGHEYACPAEFSPDGSIILLLTDGKARLWDIAARKERLVLEGHEQPVFWASFSPDGKNIITASRDRTARIWNADTGKPLHVLKAHDRNAIVWAAFTRNGTRAVTVACFMDAAGNSQPGETLGRLWDAETGKELAGLDSPFTDQHLRHPPVYFSPDGRHMFTLDYHGGGEVDGVWMLWDTTAGKCSTTIRNREHFTSVAFTPDSKRLAAFGPKLAWYNLNPGTGDRADNIRGDHPTFSPDGQRLVTVDGAGTHIWAVAGAAERKLGYWSGLSVLAASPDGRTLATRGQDSEEVIFWDVGTAAEIARLRPITDLSSSRFSPDGSRFLCWSRQDLKGLGKAGPKQICVVADVRSGQSIAVLDAGDELFSDFGISGDNQRVFAVQGQHRLTIWDVKSGKPMVDAKLDSSSPHLFNAARFSPDGRWLVTVEPGQQQYSLRDGLTGQVASVLKLQPGGLSYSAVPPIFSPDVRRVITTVDETGYVWEVPSGKLLSRIATSRLPGQAIETPRFSPDSQRVIIPRDGVTIVYEATTGKELLTLKGHGDVIAIAVYSADQSKIVTASRDKTVRLWDARSGEMLAVFKGHTEPVVSAAFTPDGRILSVDKNGAARVWPIDPVAAAVSRAPRELSAGEREQYEVPSTPR